MEERYTKYETEWREFESTYNKKQSQFQHLKEEEGHHLRCVRCWLQS